MPRVNRREIFSETDVQVFHTISRCVRRNHLCGRDRRSAQDYSHRREWIRSRLEELAGIFSIEVLGYAIMANHMHLVIRTRPDVASRWSDDEVALRWWTLFPQRRTPFGLPEQPTTEELNHIKNNPTCLADKRRRLASVSWFMKCISEPIAKRANREDEVTGHFWEARFKAQPLLDETAIAACLTYVDLNPIRAAVAQTPETSEFTSAHDRISDRQASMDGASVVSTVSKLTAGAVKRFSVSHGNTNRTRSRSRLAGSDFTRTSARAIPRLSNLASAHQSWLSVHVAGSVPATDRLDRPPDASRQAWSDSTASRSHTHATRLQPRNMAGPCEKLSSTLPNGSRSPGNAQNHPNPAASLPQFEPAADVGVPVVQPVPQNAPMWSSIQWDHSHTDFRPPIAILWADFPQKQAPRLLPQVHHPRQSAAKSCLGFRQTAGGQAVWHAANPEDPEIDLRFFLTAASGSAEPRNLSGLTTSSVSQPTPLHFRPAR